MLTYIGLAAGILLGAFIAYRRGGNRLDILHYAAILGLIGFVLGFVAMLVIPAPA